MTEKFNIQKVLIAPLDWGLGHATRCIPIINALLQQGHEVMVATDGLQQILLRKEFPQLKEKIPEGKPGNYGPESYAVSGEKTTKELGIQFRSLQESLKDMVDEFLVVEKSLN